MRTDTGLDKLKVFLFRYSRILSAALISVSICTGRSYIKDRIRDFLWLSRPVSDAEVDEFW